MQPPGLLSSHGEVLRRKRNKLSTHAHQAWPGQAASIQQLAGLGSFARVLSNPRDGPGLSKASGREEPGLEERMLPLLLHQERLSARSLGEEK